MSNQQLVQASCVAIEGRAVMILGEPGIGKSSLALDLIDRGAQLIGDDGVALSAENGRIIAAPPPNIAGKMEIRHVGIADFPAVTAPLALVISLAISAPRWVEAAPMRDVLGIEIPAITLPAHDYILALRVQSALRLHGLAAR